MKHEYYWIPQPIEKNILRALVMIAQRGLQKRIAFGSRN